MLKLAEVTTTGSSQAAVKFSKVHLQILLCSLIKNQVALEEHYVLCQYTERFGGLL